MRRVWRYGEHLGQRQCPRRQTVWKVRLSEAVYIPMFFKINGEYIVFHRMNLELNTMGDHGEEKIRWTQLAQPIDILVLKRYNSGGSAETKGIHLRTLSGENKLWGNLLADIWNPDRKDFSKKTRSIFWNLPLYYRSVWPDREVWQIHSHAIPPEEQTTHLQEDLQWTAKTNAKPLKMVL